jgi:hypothetical protein
MGKIGLGLYVRKYPDVLLHRKFSFYIDIFWGSFVLFSLICPFTIIIYPIIEGIFPIIGVASLIMATYRLGHFILRLGIQPPKNENPTDSLNLKWILMSLVFMIPELYLLYSFITLLQL